MSEWRARRFWKAVTVVPDAGGFALALDDRPLKTPAKAALLVPTRAMAEAIAAEWRAQGDRIDPLGMPVTRAANAAIDKVAPQRAEVAALTAAYAETDLLCYRAEGPADLVARQAACWDPLLAWAAAELEAPLHVTSGIVHRAQPAESLARLAARVDACSPFALTALSDMVALSGSLVIGLAAIAGQAPPEALWQISRVDEIWQQELWGPDAEAAAVAAARQRDFMRAFGFYRMCGSAEQAACSPRHRTSDDRS